jgi:hypothetical protein
MRVLSATLAALAAFSSLAAAEEVEAEVTAGGSAAPVAAEPTAEPAGAAEPASFAAEVLSELDWGSNYDPENEVTSRDKHHAATSTTPARPSPA